LPILFFIFLIYKSDISVFNITQNSDITLDDNRLKG